MFSLPAEQFPRNTDFVGNLSVGNTVAGTAARPPAGTLRERVPLEPFWKERVLCTVNAAQPKILEHLVHAPDRVVCVVGIACNVWQSERRVGVGELQELPSPFGGIEHPEAVQAEDRWLSWRVFSWFSFWVLPEDHDFVRSHSVQRAGDRSGCFVVPWRVTPSESFQSGVERHARSERLVLFERARCLNGIVERPADNAQVVLCVDLCEKGEETKQDVPRQEITDVLCSASFSCCIVLDLLCDIAGQNM